MADIQSIARDLPPLTGEMIERSASGEDTMPRQPDPAPVYHLATSPDPLAGLSDADREKLARLEWLARPRYTVRPVTPSVMRAAGFRYWVADTQHPEDRAYGDLSCCWCMDVRDAERIADALNRDEVFRRRLRETIVDAVETA